MSKNIAGTINGFSFDVKIIDSILLDEFPVHLTESINNDYWLVIINAGIEHLISDKLSKKDALLLFQKLKLESCLI